MTENGRDRDDLAALDRDTALATVDDALATGRVSAEAPLARELQDLALALEAESELPSDEFARRLDARVAAGFPRARRRRLPSLPSLTSPRALGLAGAAATLLIVVGVALEAGREEPAGLDGATPAPLSTAASEDAAPAPARAPDAGSETHEDMARSSGSPGQGRGRVAPGERERRIERAAELTLAAPGDELDSVADGIIRVTDRHRGFVLSSSVASGDDSDEGGRFDLRIPAESLQAALRDLSKLGHVRARRQSGRDITPAYVSSRDRLEAARAERRGLLRRLERAETDAGADRIRDRLEGVSLRIERLRRELGALRERTNYAAVSVDLEGTDGEGGAGGGATRDAFDDSVALLEGSLNLLVRALGVLIPLGVVAGLGWAGGRLLRRRRREAALR